MQMNMEDESNCQWIFDLGEQSVKAALQRTITKR